MSYTPLTTNGQLLIGASSGARTRVGTLTSSGSTITITNGAGTINLEAGATTPTTFTADSGTATPAANNINIKGTSAQGITSSASGSTVTYTISDWTTTQKGVGVLATNAETIAGTSTTKVVTPDDLKAKLGTQTSNGLAYGAGTTAAISWLGAATNGQLPIGSTGNAPVLATLTAGSGITITNAAGSITIAANDGGMAWTEVTGTSQTAAVDNGYVANNASLVTVTLPSSSVLGDVVKVDGKGAGLFKIAQPNAGSVIHFVGSDTTTGTGGSLTAIERYACITLRCITTNADWVVESSQGNFTIV